MTEPTDEILREWLFGALQAEAAGPLEQRLLDDADFGERLRAVEDDLLDDLARDRLSATERARALAYFAATPADRQRLRIARALARVVAAAPAPHAYPRHRVAAAVPRALPRRKRRLAGGVIALACAVAIAIVGTRFWYPANTGTPATITLLQDSQRGAAPGDIAIPPDAGVLRIQAEVDAAETGARYALRIDDDGVDVFAATGLVPRTAGAYRFVEIVLPAAKLAPGRHRVRVVAEGRSGAESSWIVSKP